MQEGLPWEGIISFGVLDAKDYNPLTFEEDLKNRKICFKRKYKEKNKITNYARQYLASILVNQSLPYPLITPSKMELGTGSGTTAATDTNLWTPATATLKACSNIQTYLTYYAQYTCTWLTSDPVQGTFTEIGLFDSNNNLWAHSAIASNFTVNAGEVLVAQWSVCIQGN